MICWTPEGNGRVVKMRQMICWSPRGEGLWGVILPICKNKEEKVSHLSTIRIPAAVGRRCFHILRFASRAPSVHFRTFHPFWSGWIPWRAHRRSSAFEELVPRMRMVIRCWVTSWLSLSTFHHHQGVGSVDGLAFCRNDVDIIFQRREQMMRTEERASEAAAIFRCVTPGNGDVIMQEAPPAVVTSEAEQETPPPSVMSEAEEYKRGFQGQEDRLCPSSQSCTKLSLFALQYLPALSPFLPKTGVLSSCHRWKERL